MEEKMKDNLSQEIKKKSMDVFSLQSSLLDNYTAFAKSFTNICAKDIREQVHAIYAKNRFWPEPLIQVNPNYEPGAAIDELAKSGDLHPTCKDIFQFNGSPLNLHKHQHFAVSIAASKESYVVTTGTGSGKSLCFFIPIVDAILREKEKRKTPKTRAIIIYPMNALANSQKEEIEKFISNVSGDSPITFARYTGQESEEERNWISNNPPDILLTNFMMLELLMTRQNTLDKTVIQNCQDLRFLVLDELHTYRGRQGADVAMLVRRVRERLAAQNLQCIGTSATMASEGTAEDKNEVISQVASKLFATEIPVSNIISETLRRVTNKEKNAENIKDQLSTVISDGIKEDVLDSELYNHPLAIWVETKLGVTWSEADRRWNRAKPLTFEEAAAKLAKDSGESEESCKNALQTLLLVASVPEVERTNNPKGNYGAFFAFKLHQFISGAGNAFTTIEPIGDRKVTVDPQQFLPGTDDTRLYATHFCRDCGQEYHPVNLVTDQDHRRVLAREIDDFEPLIGGIDGEHDTGEDSVEHSGFACVKPNDEDFNFCGAVEDYPEQWLELRNNNLVLKITYNSSQPISMKVLPNGYVSQTEGVDVWFVPGKFKFCLRCRTAHIGPGKDRNRLSSLSAEGRSSATTVLVEGVLRWMHGDLSGLDESKRKLLGFTDNRQDAALQAGHFNDFLFVSLLRSGFLGALLEAGSSGIKSDELGIKVQNALGFNTKEHDSKIEWLLEPDLRGFNLQEAERTLRDVLAYRVWFDQRRGWRFTNPNLGQLNLLKVQYEGLDDLVADEELFAETHQLLSVASPETRKYVYEVLFDHLREGLAVRSHVLNSDIVEQIKTKSYSRLKAPWGFNSEERPRPSRWLLLAGGPRRGNSLRDEDLIVRGGIRSRLGRELKKPSTWGGDAQASTLRTQDYQELIDGLLQAASKHGLVTEETTPFDNSIGWKLNDACVTFFINDQQAEGEVSSENKFFIEFYTALSQLLKHSDHPLFGFEAREHTAQVESERRAIREQRFRYGEKEKRELEEGKARLRELNEANRFLPVMFCSPTMELGVDISALNVVYMRNVPPTPANYAQRSGRAGRSGQAALVITYCAARSPHDQYFFKDPREMVHGQVKAPLLDLANQDLVESHLQAIWLACTNYPLASEISEILKLEGKNRPVQDEIKEALSKPEVAKIAIPKILNVINQLQGDLTEENAPWFPDAEELAKKVASKSFEKFDKSFNRWRSLFKAAEEQRDSARKVMDNYSAPQREKRAANARHNQAVAQIELLQKGNSTSDFYTYRYLATEGFLPGYNFPRLPLMAYVPSTGDGKGSRQTYLQRPRFLALSEFGPRSLVYHEGRAFRVTRAMVSLGQARGDSDAQLPTMTARICKACGAGHFKEDLNNCHSCDEPLSTAEIVRSVFRIENVATQPAERITANDEERQRQGFELQTVFEWATRGSGLDVRKGDVSDDSGKILDLAYGPGTQITRINKGLKRRANQSQYGFKIDPLSGFWAKNDDEEEDSADPLIIPKQWIVPCVQDRKNALLINLASNNYSQETIATVQYAILRGIEENFQLEEGEILGEPMPVRDSRTGFLLYEATEGGAGVLARMVSESNSLSKIAKEALKIMHFALPEDFSSVGAYELHDVEDAHCVAGCYRCLLSYFNQMDHEIIDRRDEHAKDLLLRLARSSTNLQKNSIEKPTEGQGKSVNADSADFLNALSEHEIPMPDGETLDIGGESLPNVWRRHFVVAHVGQMPSEVRKSLENKGFEIVIFEKEASEWALQMHNLKSLVGQ